MSEEKNRKRKIQIIFRVDEDEYDFIKSKYEASKKSTFAAFIRSMLIRGRVINIRLDDLKILSANVGRFSASANQIAKRVNATENVYDEDIAEIKNMETEIWQELKSIRLALRSISQ